MPTCQTRPTAKPTRIDGILANKTALTCNSGFQGIKDERIPTHAVLQIKLDRENLNESIMYAESLPSLKSLVDQKVAENTKDKQGKEKANIEEAQAQQLKDQIDKNLKEANRGLRIYQKANDTSGFWRTWSKAVERGILQYLDEGKVFNRKASGRGKVTFIDVKPKRKDGGRKGTDNTRGEESIAAEKTLRQARRCEQYAFRLGLLQEEKRSQEQRLTYYELNKDAAKDIRKNIGESQWEKELEERIR